MQWRRVTIGAAVRAAAVVSVAVVGLGVAGCASLFATNGTAGGRQDSTFHELSGAPDESAGQAAADSQVDPEVAALTDRVQRYVRTIPGDSLTERVARHDGQTMVIPESLDDLPSGWLGVVAPSGEASEADVSGSAGPLTESGRTSQAPVVMSVSATAGEASSPLAPTRPTPVAVAAPVRSAAGPVAERKVEPQAVAQGEGSMPVATGVPNIGGGWAGDGPKPPPTVVSVEVQPGGPLSRRQDASADQGRSNRSLGAAEGAGPIGLRDTIDVLRDELSKAPNQARKQLALRLLSVLDGQADLARATMPGTNEDLQVMLDALVDVLVAMQPTGGEGLASDSGQTLDAVDNLRALVRRRTDLRIPTVLLCRGILSFGDYDAIEPAELPAGRDAAVGVYCEVENFASTRAEDGRYKTSLTFRVQIFSADGTVVYEESPEPVVDLSRRQRQDFFLRKRIRIPASLEAGQYTLKVAITDTQAGKHAEARKGFKLVAGDQQGE